MPYDGKSQTFMVRPEFQSITLHNLFNNTSKPQLPRVYNAGNKYFIGLLWLVIMYTEYLQVFCSEQRLIIIEKVNIEFMLVLRKMFFSQMYGGWS